MRDLEWEWGRSGWPEFSVSTVLLPNHEPSLLLMNCGEQRQVRPAMGASVTYGMGTENQNLPGFDHEQLTYRFAGRDFRLTDVESRVVEELIA